MTILALKRNKLLFVFLWGMSSTSEILCVRMPTTRVSSTTLKHTSKMLKRAVDWFVVGSTNASGQLPMPGNKVSSSNSSHSTDTKTHQSCVGRPPAEFALLHMGPEDVATGSSYRRSEMRRFNTWRAGKLPANRDRWDIQPHGRHINCYSFGDFFAGAGGAS